MATTSNTSSTWAWRVPLILGGIATFVGGGMHPDGKDSDQLAERLGTMIVGNEKTWIIGHGLMTIGAAMLLVGFIVARKAQAWPSASRALAIAIPATAFSVFDLALHTLDVVDGDELLAGTVPLLTWVHLAVAFVGGVVFGLAAANLAWSLGRIWGGPRLLIAALGIVGGLASVFAVPVVMIFGANFLFPIAGLGVAFWAIATGIAGAPTLEPSIPVRATAA